MSPPKTVLLIDDEHAIATALLVRLSSSGYTVIHAPDGASGLAAARESQPDVILLDLRMPDINGFEVKRRLQREADLADIPVIFLTANAHERNQKNAFALGAHAFLAKPFEARELLATIEEAVAKTSASDARSNSTGKTHAC